MKSLAPAEPYQVSFEASVASVDGTEVTLEETYFYPEGGGQPADRGHLGETAVVDVQSRGGEAVHHLATEPAFEAGDTVAAAVDSAFRTYCMRAHTASHVLYGAGRQLLDDLGYGGFDISAPEGDRPSAEGKVRVDFTTPTAIDDTTLVELERLTNRAVWDSRPVSWERMDQETALSRPEIAFNTKTEEGLSGDTVRVVTVEDWDVAACGGTHVRNTREIGPVTILERSNPGEGLTRVEFAVGYRAIEARATDRQHATAAASTLQTGIEELPDAVSRLNSENQELQSELDDLTERLVDARLAELRDAVVRKDGRAWLVGSVPGLDANGLSDRAQRAVGDGTDVVALVDEDGQYLAVATTGDVDAGGVVDRVTGEFGGGGGGSPTVAQGGGLGADPEQIVGFLRQDFRPSV
jgi:alanyl-tRNA synthetase